MHSLIQCLQQPCGGGINWEAGPNSPFLVFWWVRNRKWKKSRPIRHWFQVHYYLQRSASLELWRGVCFTCWYFRLRIQHQGAFTGQGLGLHVSLNPGKEGKCLVKAAIETKDTCISIIWPTKDITEQGGDAYVLTESCSWDIKWKK